MALAAAGVRIPNCWEAVGRGTEVGRALFALYNGYGVARNRGNEFSDRNRMKILQRLANLSLEDICEAEKQELPPPKPKKPAVKVPHFHKRQMTVNDIPHILLMRGRRKSSQILRKLKQEIATREQPPVPTRPVLDEKEKQRLQYVFEWSGRDCCSDDEEEPVAAKRSPARGSVEEQDMLMEELAEEIRERRVFLDRMYELGRGPKYEPVIQGEIQDRLRQMELLDKTITLMDKERLESRPKYYSPRSSLASRASSKQSTRSVCGESDRGYASELDKDAVGCCSDNEDGEKEKAPSVRSSSPTPSQMSGKPPTGATSGRIPESRKSVKPSRGGSRPTRQLSVPSGSNHSRLRPSIAKAEA